MCYSVLTPKVKDVKERAIDIEWADRKLAKSCASDKAGQRRWGAERWPILRRRLSSLRAAPSLADMRAAPGRCHALTADRSDQFALLLWGSYRLVFEPIEPVPRMRDGGIDREKVTAIRIQEVVDYHGK